MDAVLGPLLDQAAIDDILLFVDCESDDVLGHGQLLASLLDLDGAHGLIDDESAIANQSRVTGRDNTDATTEPWHVSYVHSSHLHSISILLEYFSSLLLVLSLQFDGPSFDGSTGCTARFECLCQLVNINR